MYRLFPVFLFLLMTNGLFGQAGIYRYEDKSSGTSERLELRGDGTFVFEESHDWSTSKVTGNWKKRGSSKVALNSKYQLTDYIVIEKEDKTIEEGVRLELRGHRKGQEFRNIKRVFMNLDESLVFWPDGEAAMAEIQDRERMQRKASLSPQVRDSITNTNPAHHYHCKESIDSVTSIVIVHGKKEFVYNPQNQQANRFVVITKFAKSSNYRYMKDEEYLFDKKSIQRVRKGHKMKKTKK